MSQREFDAACARRGYRREGFAGYYDIGGGICVSVLNAGQNRRERLAYLIAEERRHDTPFRRSLGINPEREARDAR